MTEQVPVQPYDEPLGDSADQASLLQMAEEQAAIHAALEGRVDGTDAIEDRSAFIEPLEGPEATDGDGADAVTTPCTPAARATATPRRSRPPTPRSASA